MRQLQRSISGYRKCGDTISGLLPPMGRGWPSEASRSAGFGDGAVPCRQVTVCHVWGSQMKKLLIAIVALTAPFAQPVRAQTVVPPGNQGAEQPAVPGASTKRTKSGGTTFDAKYRKVYNLLKTDKKLRSQDQAAGFGLRHRPDAHCRRDRRRAHLQCRRL